MCGDLSALYSENWPRRKFSVDSVFRNFPLVQFHPNGRKKTRSNSTHFVMSTEPSFPISPCRSVLLCITNKVLLTIILTKISISMVYSILVQVGNG